MGHTKAAPRLLAVAAGCLVLLTACLPPESLKVKGPSPVLTPTPREALGAARVATVPTRAPAPADADVAPPGPPRAGAPAADFALEDLDGGTVSLADLRGQAVILNFWASWCGPCQMEIPHMTHVYGELRDEGLEIVAVNVREDERRVAGFVQEMGMDFIVLLDPAGRVARDYYVRGIPTTVFIDAQGTVRDVHVGTLTEEALRYYVDRLMG